MPIIDYERTAERAKEHFFADETVSDKNKGYVKRFLAKYDVEGRKPSRKSIFLKHIVYLLRLTPDIVKDMDKKDNINNYFAQIKNAKLKTEKRPMSLATYQTIINVSNAFVRWLNDGEKPKGFADIKNNKRAKRDLTPKDMLTWEDVKKMLAATTDIQMQAIISTQAEGGLRPSEFVDLEYGDIKFNGNGITAITVKGSKTDDSRRTRNLYDASPYLMRWLKEHPLKKRNSPLWVKMRTDDKHEKKKPLEKYGYRAMQLRLIDIGKKAGIEKPLDFYALRHSAIVMTKIGGLADSMAMKEFGHKTTRMYSEVYGRLSDEDQRKAIEKMHGLDSEQVEQEKTVLCKICGRSNVPNSDYCEQCGHPVSAKAIEELKAGDRKKEQQLSEVKDSIKKELMKEILKEMKK